MISIDNGWLLSGIMMMKDDIHFYCPHCSRWKKANKRDSGKYARCSCGGMIQIPNNVTKPLVDSEPDIAKNFANEETRSSNIHSPIQEENNAITLRDFLLLGKILVSIAVFIICIAFFITLFSRPFAELDILNTALTYFCPISIVTIVIFVAVYIYGCDYQCTNQHCQKWWGLKFVESTLVSEQKKHGVVKRKGHSMNDRGITWSEWEVRAPTILATYSDKYICRRCGFITYTERSKEVEDFSRS